MKPITILSLAGLALAPLATAQAASISASDLLIYQVGSSTTDTATAAGSTVLIDEINPSLLNQISPVQSFNITSLSSNGFFGSNDGSVGDVTLSDNNTLLTFSGWTSSGSVEANVAGRGAGILDANGNFTLGPTYSDSTAATQPRSAFTPDGTNWYFGDKAGIYAPGSSTILPSSPNTRDIKSYGGVDYALSQKTTGFLGTLSPTVPNGSSVTFTGLNGIPTDGNATDFALVSSGNSGTGVYDTLYYVEGANKILKYALLSGVWTAEGTDTLATTFKFSQLTAEEVSGSVDLFLTNDPSSGAATLDEVTDSAAFNAALVGSGASTLYTAPVGDVLQGVSLAPTAAAVPEPSTWASMIAGLFALVGFGIRRSRNRSVLG